jgi:hypothetical protein
MKNVYDLPKMVVICHRSTVHNIHTPSMPRQRWQETKQDALMEHSSCRSHHFVARVGG